MDVALLTIAFITGLAIGLIVAWVFSKSRQAQLLAESLADSKAQIASLSERVSLREQEIQVISTERDQRTAVEQGLRLELIEAKGLTRELETRLSEERRGSSEKIAELHRIEERLQESFQALSADALRANNQTFLDLARVTLERFQVQAQGDLDQRQRAVEILVAPIKDSLERYDRQIQLIERSRNEAYGSLSRQVESLLVSQQRLESETSKLVNALRMPQVRGRWGEFQLRKVVELAGMSSHCDFVEQENTNTETGRLRPDLIVKLPGKKNVVVDSKAPLKAYLDALEVESEEQRKALLQLHARQIRAHLQSLSNKSYWNQLQDTPEFVVLFIPGEPFLSAAIEYDANLLEDGVKQRVIFATPLTLIALLRAVAYGWRQELIAENARKISDLGKELYDRIATFARHFRSLGQNLSQSVKAYNDTIGSLESRILVSARKFKELGATVQEDILEISQIEQEPREVRMSEFLEINEEVMGE